MYTIKHSFFCESIDENFLSPEESNHAVRVLRLKEGNAVTLIDGKGKVAEGVIQSADKKKVLFSVKNVIQHPSKNQFIHIAIAPTKNMDRFSFFIEKVIEIGIDQITPILTSNSERKVLNSDKIRKNAISALKQSGNYFLPHIDDLTPFRDFVDQDFDNNQLFIAHCEDDIAKNELKNKINTEKKVIILIGPEGDFTPEEIKLAKQKHFEPVSLGESRLRTETAGIVACHTVNII